jgi:hypothetical protein
MFQILTRDRVGNSQHEWNDHWGQVFRDYNGSTTLTVA